MLTLLYVYYLIKSCQVSIICCWINLFQSNKNKDGLQYAELVFNPVSNGAKFVIHGDDNRTIYAVVDTTQKIDPLPDSDEEDDEPRSDPGKQDT